MKPPKFLHTKIRIDLMRGGGAWYDKTIWAGQIQKGLCFQLIRSWKHRMTKGDIQVWVFDEKGIASRITCRCEFEDLYEGK